MSEFTEVEIAGVGLIAVVGLKSDILYVRSTEPLPPGTRVTVQEHGTLSVLAEGKVISVASGIWEGKKRLELRIKLFAPPRSNRLKLRAHVQRKEDLEFYQKNEPPK